MGSTQGHIKLSATTFPMADQQPTYRISTEPIPDDAAAEHRERCNNEMNAEQLAALRSWARTYYNMSTLNLDIDGDEF